MYGVQVHTTTLAEDSDADADAAVRGPPLLPVPPLVRKIAIVVMLLLLLPLLLQQGGDNKSKDGESR